MVIHPQARWLTISPQAGSLKLSRNEEPLLVYPNQLHEWYHNNSTIIVTQWALLNQKRLVNKENWAATSAPLRDRGKGYTLLKKIPSRFQYPNEFSPYHVRWPPKGPLIGGSLPRPAWGPARLQRNGPQHPMVLFPVLLGFPQPDRIPTEGRTGESL